MKLLILGGGVFLAAAALQAAVARGHAVTVFNRGRARGVWPEGVEVLTGDRSADLGALNGRRWDAVIDLLQSFERAPRSNRQGANMSRVGK